MRRVLDSSGLNIDRKTYYNLVRNKPLEDGILNNSFKAIILALKKVGFHFNYDIGSELAEDSSIKGRVLD